MNVMTYSRQNLGAVWTIFDVKDRAKVSSFLKGHPSTSHVPGDPIHSRSIFLTEQLLKDLREYGVSYYQFTQMPHEAVVIPAGAIHQVSVSAMESSILTPRQVSNKDACIKVATDFCTVESLGETLSVGDEFYAAELPDIIQAQSTIYFAWQSLLSLASKITPGPEEEGSKKKRRRNVHNTYRKKVKRSADAPPAPYSCPHEDCLVYAGKATFAKAGLVDHIM